MKVGKRVAIACITAALFAGCSMDNPFMAPQSAAGKPVVWDCVPIGIGSPSKYVCPDGKTYTAFQLRDFRQNAAKHGGNTVASK